VSHKKVVHEPVSRILARCREELYSLFYRALLQKRAMILRRLLIVATPYTNQDLQSWLDVERSSYGVATISRLLKMIGLIYRI